MQTITGTRAGPMGKITLGTDIANPAAASAATAADVNKANAPADGVT